MSLRRGPSTASGVLQGGTGSGSTPAFNSERKYSTGEPGSSVLPAAVMARASLPVLPFFHLEMRIALLYLYCRNVSRVNQVTQRESPGSGNRRRLT